MYLLDTNVVSELRKIGRGQGDPNVTHWFENVHERNLYLSVITIMELELGIARLDRHDPTQASLLRRWLREKIEPVFCDGILAIDAETAARCALLHVPNPRPERDAWIAATALTHNLTIVTRNVPDFTGTGAAIVNPWTAQPEV